MMAVRNAPPTWADQRAEACRAVERLVSYGTAAVCDIANAGDTAPLFADAGISGIVQHEFLSMDPAGIRAQLEAIEVCGSVLRTDRAVVVTRPAPHAAFSTAPELVVASARQEDHVPSTIHIAEDVDELDFLRDGTGSYADFMDELGVPWRWWEPPGLTPVAYLDNLGVLGPGMLLVHGVHASWSDRQIISKRGSPLCLCARSNAYIGGRLPDVPALMEAGVRLCLGTDSLASNTDLDIMGEVALLMETFPDLDAGIWLELATRGGASALQLDHLGEIAVGRCPGLLLLKGIADPSELTVPPERTWICRPGVPIPRPSNAV
jgi:cytosine/adenosine deaminase-related metal-dependent hydrolase